MRTALAALIALSLFALAPRSTASALPSTGSSNRAIQRGVGGTTLHSIQSGGLQRWYRVFSPADARPNDELPVLVCFHGGGGSASGPIERYGIVEEARQRGWVAVFPEGTGPLGGPPLFRLQTWNGGGCCGWAQQNDVDDVQFFADMLARLDVTHPVDLDRVFVTGMSNGAIMTYRIAVERPDLVRGIAPVGGALETAPPTQPVPILAIHGLRDSYVPIGGGVGANGNGYSFNSQVDSIVPFLDANGGTPFQFVKDVGTARIHVSPAVPGGAETWFFLALDGGHAWPGTRGLPVNPNEPVHSDVPATPLIFDFFELL